MTAPIELRYRISQVGMVVADLDSTMKAYHEAFGWGPWSIFEYKPPWLRDLRVHGEPAEFTWLGAEAPAGETWIELLQPLTPSPLADWLERHGDGVNHIGYEAASMEEATSLHDHFERLGFRELLSAWCGDVFFYYVERGPRIFEVWVGSSTALTPVRTYP
jgi:methylmalonyl-CoA/ethylmalonyl-CoA epimerase